MRNDSELVENLLEERELLDAIQECHAIVGMRFHSVVFASASYVQSLALTYQPKCLDFMRSIDREDFSVSSADFSEENLVSKLDELAEHRDSHSEDLIDRVGKLRHKLVHHLRGIGSSIGSSAND